MNGVAFYHVDDLKIKIEQLLISSDESLDSQSREILDLVYKQVDSFEETAKTTLNTGLDRAIRCEVYELQGVVAEIKGSIGVELSKEEVENLKQKIHSFTPKLKMEEQRCSDGLYHSFPDDEEEDDDHDECADIVTSKIIGVRDVYEQLKDSVMSEKLVSLVGMPGIGKTALANKIFHDPEIVERFDYCVWVRVGKKCQLKDIPRRILAKIDPDSVVALCGVDGKAVDEWLKACLESKRYLIVLDDVWDRYITYLWHPFFRYKDKELNHPFLQWGESESRILITSRLQQLNKHHKRLAIYAGVVQMRLLNKEESWNLLCDKVFGGGPCPAQLEKVGKEISKNCEGLPLTILTVARLLSVEEKSTLAYWSQVADKKNHQLFLDAYDEISKVLLPSYTYLPPLLQMCFLFIGLFPRNHEIPRSKLVNLWLADRFSELNINIDSNLDAIRCLEQLISNSVLMVYKQSTVNFTHTLKTCGLHSSLWYLSKQKARETKFALLLTSPSDCLGDGMKGHHRLSIQSNVLFAMKDVHKSVEDNCASDVRSLLCFGPYHQYQVPLCFRLELLRELDALSIRFYEFPVEVLQLIQLRYLALTTNGSIPASISQLSYLQFFIVDRHQHIKSCGDHPYLPVEIWGLQDLRHLQVMGGDLPDPCGASLIKLSTLSNVSFRSCTEAVFKGLPYLKELRVRIELAPDGDGKPLSCFTHISCLSFLELLKCIVVNPEIVPPVIPFSSFPERYLRTLCLSGLSYPWKEMSKIASLPNLYVLKLKNYAFQGPVWVVEEKGFPELGSLLIEDTDIVDWQFGCGALKGLVSLVIKNCYKLEKVHGEFGKYLSKIELVDCNPSCVKEMKKAIQKNKKCYRIDVLSSLDDDKRKT